MTMTRLDQARARVAELAAKLENRAPYLDHKDFKEHGPIVAALLDGCVSMQSARDVDALPGRAAALADSTRGRYTDREGLRRYIGRHNFEQRFSGDLGDLLFINPDGPGMQKAVASVTENELADWTKHLQEKEAWYREGEQLASALAQAVRDQLAAQPESMTLLETMKDTVLKARRKVGV